MSNVPELIASLNETPDAPELVAALERELALAEAWSDYATLLPQRIRGLSDAVERTRFLIRAAHVCRHYGDNGAAADDLLLEAVEISLLPEDLVTATQRAFAPHNDWAGLVATSMDLAELAPTDQHGSRLMFAVGKAYEDRLYNPERAISCYQRAFKQDPAFTEPLHHARQIYAHADQWSTVARLYTIELKVVREPRARARLLKELGNVQMERLGERDAAIASFREAVALDPDYSGLNDVIANLQSGSGAHGVVIDPGAISTLEADVELRPVTVEATVVPTADVDDDAGDDEAPAAEVAEAAAEDEEPVAEAAAEDEGPVAEDDAPVAEEEALAAEDDALAAEDEAAEDDAPAAEDEAAEDDAPPAEVEEPAAEYEEPVAEDEELAAEYEEPVAEDEELAAEDEEPAAEDEALAAEDEAPVAEDEAAAAEDEESAEIAAAPPTPTVSAGPSPVSAVDGLAAYIEEMRTRALAGGAESLDALAWAVELSLASEVPREEVVDLVVEALEAADDPLASVRALLPAAFGQDGFWASLSEALAEAGGPAGARYGVLFYALGDPESASAYAEDAGAIAAMERDVLDVASKGNWRKTHQGLQDALGHLGDAAETEAYRAQIAIALGMGKVDKAADSARRVLRSDKGDVDAQAFSRALNRALERWNPVADALKHLAAVAAEADPFRERLLIREQVELYRNALQQPAAVMQGLQRLSESDPTDVAVMDELIALLNELNNHRELVNVLRRKAEAVDDVATKIALQEEVATLFVERFNNQAEALACYEAILELDPGNENALLQLEDLYERRREWSKLIDTKRQLVEMMASESEQARLLRDSAEVAATRLRDNALAEQLWSEVLAVSPTDEMALESLERLHERAKAWDKLADVLVQRVDGIEAPEARAAALLKLGQIQADRLSDTAASVATWEQLLELEPENARAKDALRKAYTELEQWDALEAFYERDGAWAEYVRQIESIAGSHDDAGTAVSLLFRAATIWGERLDEPLRATKALERVLSIDDRNEAAARALVPVYEERGDAKRLAEVLEIRLAHDTDAAVRHEAMVQLARLAADRRQHDAALSWFIEAMGEQPHDVSIAEEMELAAAQEGAWARLRAAWESAREALADESAHHAEWLDLSLRLGRVLDQKLDDARGALACFDDVVAHEPANEVALDAKDAIFTRLGDWDALLEVIEAKLGFVDASDSRVALLERSCLIHEEHREDYEAAILGYSDILSVSPRHEAALLALHRLYRHAGEPHALAETLRTLIEVREAAGLVEERRALQNELASVLIEQLEEHEAGIEVLERVVRESPTDPSARGLLERELGEDDESIRVRVARLLEPLYESDNAHRQLVEVLEIQVANTLDASDSAALLSRIGDAHAGPLSDASAAMDAYGRLLRVAPGDASAQERLEAVAASSGTWEPVVELYEVLLDQLSAADARERGLAVAFGLRASTLFDRELGSVDDAVRMLRRVQDFDATHVDALDGLEQLFTRTAQWEDLLGVLRERLQVTESSEDRRALHFKVASIQQEMLDDPGAAIDAYREVLLIAPEDREALESLDQLYGATADSASRAEVLEQRVRLAEEGSTDQLALQNRLALIYEDELGEVPRALELWRRVLSQDPSNLNAIEGLEAQLETEDYAVAASEILEPLYMEQGIPERLVRLLEIRLRDSHDPDARRSLYDRIATLHEAELDAPAEAVRVLMRAAEEFLSDASLLDRAERLVAGLGTWSSLAEQLEAFADETLDPSVRHAVLVRVARIREVSLSDLGGAAQIWRRVLEDSPTDGGALDALERLDGELGEWPELIEILQRKADASAEDAASWKPLLFRAASLHEIQLGQVDEAVEVTRSILMRDPTDRDAIDQLERLFTTSGRWDDLVENTERKLALVEDPQERRGLQFALGAVLERELEDADRALDAYRAVLAVDDTDLEALAAMDRLLVQTENWSELLTVLESQACLVEVPEEARNIRYRMGRLQATELMDTAAAVATYREILSEDSTHAGTRSALAQMVESGEEALAAAEILEPIYRSEGAWDRLVAINETRIEHALSPEDRRSLHIDTATIHEQHRLDVSAALSSWFAASRELPRASELSQIERLAPVEESWPQVAELYAELWDDALEPATRVEIGGRLARIYEEELADAARAIDAYGRLLEEAPETQFALDALDRLYTSRGAADELAEILQRRVLLGGASNDGVALRLRLAGLQAGALDQPMDAIQTYREVLDASHHNAAALDALEQLASDGVELFEVNSILEPLFREQGDWDRLVGLAITRIEHEDSEDERYRLWLEIADVREQQLGDAAGAMAALGRALSERPSDDALLARIEGLGEQADAWEAVATLYGALLGEDFGDEDLLRLAVRRARVFEASLHDAARAEDAWRHALSIEPGSEPALRALDGLTSADGRWADNVGILARLREATLDPTEQIALAFRQAVTLRDELGDHDGAREAFQEALELDPVHRPSLDALARLYRTSSAWESLFDVLEQLQAVAAEESERVSFTREMARLASSELQRPNDAIDLWQSITLSIPHDSEALSGLAALYEATDQPMEWVEIIDRQIEQESDVDAKASLLQKAGHIWSTVLDNPDLAIARYRTLLDLRPGSPLALHPLRELYERVGDFEPLADVLQQLLDLGEIAPDAEASVYEQLGGIYADTLMRPADAISAWKAVLGRRPGDLDALDRLESLYEQQEAWRPLVDVLEEKASVTEDPDDRIALLKRIAGLWLNRLASSEQAADVFERVMELDEADHDASVALEGIYEANEDWAALADVLLTRRDTVDDTWERLTLLRRVASLYETSMARPDHAFLVMQSAALEAPLDEDVRVELERLAKLSEKQDEMVECYRAMIDRVANGEDTAEEDTLPLLLALGRFQDQELARPEMAEVYYDKALTLDAENEVALAALRSIYERTEDWASLVGILKRLASLSYDTAAQSSLYAEAGALLETRVGDIPESIEAYKMALRIDEAHAPSLGALERIYAEHGFWRELVDVLERKAESVYDTAALVPLRLRIASVWRDELDDADRAIDAFVEVTDVDPENRDALDALERLYAELGRWDAFLEVLDSRLISAVDPAARIRIYSAQALVFEAQFDDVDRAVDALNEVLLLDPKHLETILTLERLFTEQERTLELIDALERHVDAVDDVADKCVVLMRMAETQVDHLDDVPRAIETYNRILQLDDGHEEGLRRLGSLYEAEERFPEAIGTYERLASVVSEPAAKVRLLHRVGRLIEEKLGDLPAAEQRYRATLAVDEAFLPAMVGLERIHEAEGRWAELVDGLQTQIEFRRDLKERAACMVRMADVHLHRLEDRERAQHLYEEAIALDDENTDAARSLVGLFFENQDWVRCKPLLELVLTDDEALAPEIRVELYTQQGVVDEALGYHDAAVRAFEQALSIAPGHLPAQLGVARGYARRGDKEQAFSVTMEILAKHRDEMDASAAVECYFQAGELKRELGDVATARSMFENAVDLEPTHEPSLRRVLEMANEQGDASGVVRAQRRLLRVVTDEQERFTLLVDIGDACKALGQVDEAEEAYREAVAIDASSKIVLNRLLTVFMEGGNWRRATEVLGQLARLEEDSERKAKLCFTIGAIFRDELGEKDDAVAFFNQALDAKFDYLEAFEAVDHLLTSARDWTALERNYRKMIERVKSQGNADHHPLQVTLLRNLGEIYRSRLQQHDKAIAAYELASQLAPDDEMLLTILTELLERADAEPARVIAAHKRLLKASWSRIDSYRALYKAHARAGDQDKAWAMASVLTLLNKATAEESAFYAEGLKGGLQATNGTLTAEHWRLLLHPDLDPQVNQIFETIASSMRPQFSRDLKRTWNVNKRSDRLTDEYALVKMVQYVGRAIGAGDIQVYQKPDQAGLLNANTDPVALIAGQDMVRGQSQRDLAFQVAKAVAMTRPMFYLASAFADTNTLKVFFFAAFAVVTGQIADPTNEEAIKRYAYEIQDLPEIHKKTIVDAMRTLTEAGRNPDLSAWLRDVDHTANRVGLLFCGDLRSAVNCIRAEKLKIGKAADKDKVKALLLYSISDEYAALRRALGFHTSTGQG